jgi:hypothetical protein
MMVFIPPSWTKSGHFRLISYWKRLPLRIHIKRSYNGQLVGCDSDATDYDELMQACFDQVPTANWWTGEVYYRYELPVDVYPEYPARPEF